MSLSLEKLPSAAVTVTGRVAEIHTATHILRSISVNFFSCRKVKRSMFVMFFDRKCGKLYTARSLPSISSCPSWAGAVLRIWQGSNTSFFDMLEKLWSTPNLSFTSQKVLKFLIKWREGYIHHHIKKCGFHFSKCIANRLIWRFITKVPFCGLLLLLLKYSLHLHLFTHLLYTCLYIRISSISVAGEGIFGFLW